MTCLQKKAAERLQKSAATSAYQVRYYNSLILCVCLAVNLFFATLSNNSNNTDSNNAKDSYIIFPLCHVCLDPFSQSIFNNIIKVMQTSWL